MACESSSHLLHLGDTLLENKQRNKQNKNKKPLEPGAVSHTDTQPVQSHYAHDVQWLNQGIEKHWNPQNSAEGKHKPSKTGYLGSLLKTTSDEDALVENHVKKQIIVRKVQEQVRGRWCRCSSAFCYCNSLLGTVSLEREKVWLNWEFQREKVACFMVFRKQKEREYAR